MQPLYAANEQKSLESLIPLNVSTFGHFMAGDKLKASVQSSSMSDSLQIYFNETTLPNAFVISLQYRNSNHQDQRPTGTTQLSLRRWLLPNSKFRNRQLPSRSEFCTLVMPWETSTPVAWHRPSQELRSNFLRTANFHLPLVKAAQILQSNSSTCNHLSSNHRTISMQERITTAPNYSNHEATHVKK